MANWCASAEIFNITFLDNFCFKQPLALEIYRVWFFAQEIQK